MDNKHDILQLLRSVADGSTRPEDANSISISFISCSISGTF